MLLCVLLIAVLLQVEAGFEDVMMANNLNPGHPALNAALREIVRIARDMRSGEQTHEHSRVMLIHYVPHSACM